MAYPLISKYRKRVLFILFVLVIIQIIANFQSQDETERRTSVVYRLVNFISSPIQAGLAWIEDRSTDSIRHYLWLVDTQTENGQLREKVTHLTQLVESLIEIRQENLRLRELLNFKEKTELALIPAAVITKSVSSEFKSIAIDKGESAGVQTGMAVVSPHGIVGKILQTYADRSDVILITDTNFSIDAIVQRLRIRAIASGASWNRMRLKFLEKRHNLQVDDTLVSSGLAGIFPKGLKIGTVSRVSRDPNQLFQSATISPSVELDTLEEVFVVSHTAAVPPSPTNEKQ